MSYGARGWDREKGKGVYRYVGCRDRERVDGWRERVIGRAGERTHVHVREWASVQASTHNAVPCGVERCDLMQCGVRTGRAARFAAIVI